MLQSIENISSYVQCRWLNVWSVYFYFDTLFCHLKHFFPAGMGGVQNSSGNSGGVGGYFSARKMEIPRRRGAYMKFPLWWGYGYFLELHIEYKIEGLHWINIPGIKLNQY